MVATRVTPDMHHSGYPQLAAARMELVTAAAHNNWPTAAAMAEVARRVINQATWLRQLLLCQSLVSST
jgi:hypothetical protein